MPAMEHGCAGHDSCTIILNEVIIMQKRGKTLWMLLLCIAIVLSIAAVPVSARENGETGSTLQSLPPEQGNVSGGEDTEWDSQELFAGYANKELYSGTSLAVSSDVYYGTQGGNQLPGLTRKFYDYLKAELGKVASGQTDSAEIVVPLSYLGLDRKYSAKDLGVPALWDSYGYLTQEAEDAMLALIQYDADMLLNALLMDCPYDLYWFDKTIGMYYYIHPGISFTPDGSYLYFAADMPFQFTVAKEYSSSNTAGTYVTDLGKTSAARTAKENARAVVGTYSRASDLDKLLGYAKEICTRVDYNYDAVNNGNTPYGNPWQLIWVFDNNPATDVVCEGYSKAFQYLCELTDFHQNIRCHSVSGYVNGGAHMWNLMEMDDGKSYPVDVTGCDGNGFDERFFLKGSTQATTSGFSYVGNSYTYDPEMNWWFRPEQLIMSGSDYSPNFVRTQRVYRIYNPGNGKHHYTTDVEERDTLAAGGWFYEGVAWNAPMEGAPIYRVYNPGNDNHLYTMDAAERDRLVKGGWKYEGILCYSAGSDGVPLYRVFNPYVTLNPLHYTDSLEECAFLESNGWRVEGISWYGLK